MDVLKFRSSGTHRGDLASLFHAVAATRVTKSNGARGMTAFMDVLAGISVAAQLHAAPFNPSPTFASHSMVLAKEELRSGMYKEYTVDVPESGSTLEDVRKGYKTAAETDEGKTKVCAVGKKTK